MIYTGTLMRSVTKTNQRQTRARRGMVLWMRERKRPASQTCVCECHNTTPSTRSTGKTALVLAKRLHAGTTKRESK